MRYATPYISDITHIIGHSGRLKSSALPCATAPNRHFAEWPVRNFN
ncbi:hypothetical protein RTCIAT899_PC06010 (plasmid) [Rhizobium tropici CIAT 899]|nr:hypothetical protein RTCIAT899_PC06010 [Rhizobium tropici CIAT 899]